MFKVCLYCHNNFEASTGHYRYCSTKCRFWDKVEILGPDECWNWTANKDRCGYGHFRYKKHLINAHRLAWILTHGPIPDNLQILHHCDNPACCNPDHLFLGTIVDNAIDMVKKGRQHVQRLSWQQVMEIKRELAKGILHRILAKRYAVTPTTICDIKKGKRWSHVIGPMRQLNLFP